MRNAIKDDPLVQNYSYREVHNKKNNVQKIEGLQPKSIAISTAAS